MDPKILAGPAGPGRKGVGIGVVWGEGGRGGKSRESVAGAAVERDFFVPPSPLSATLDLALLRVPATVTSSAAPAGEGAPPRGPLPAG